MHRHHRQRGVTAIGWLTILGLIGFFTLMGLKIGPLYMEFKTIASVIEAVAQENRGTARVNKREFISAVDRRLEVNSIKSVRGKDLEFKRIKGGRMEVILDYEARAELFGNLSAVAAFNKRVVVGGDG